MQNVFDRTVYPSREPSSVVAGGRWVWRKAELSQTYSPDDYSLQYRFTNQSDTDIAHTANAVTDAGVFVMEVPATLTQVFDSGVWLWEAIVTRTSDSATAVVDHGYVDVTSTLEASHTLKVLKAIRATIEGTATREESSYSIGGRSLSVRPIAELMELEAKYSRRWKQERDAADRKAGRPVSRVLVKMGA